MQFELFYRFAKDKDAYLERKHNKAEYTVVIVQTKCDFQGLSLMGGCAGNYLITAVYFDPIPDKNIWTFLACMHRRHQMLGMITLSSKVWKYQVVT